MPESKAATIAIWVAIIGVIAGVAQAIAPDLLKILVHYYSDSEHSGNSDADLGPEARSPLATSSTTAGEAQPAVMSSPGETGLVDCITSAAGDARKIQLCADAAKADLSQKSEEESSPVAPPEQWVAAERRCKKLRDISDFVKSASSGSHKRLMLDEGVEGQTYRSRFLGYVSYLDSDEGIKKHYLGEMYNSFDREVCDGKSYCFTEKKRLSQSAIDYEYLKNC